MKKLAAVLVFLLLLAIPALASEIVFSAVYNLRGPMGGPETVTLTLIALNDPVVVKPGAGNTYTVYTKADTALRLTKDEEPGGYAHGVSYWVNSGDRVDILYSNGHNGGIDFPAFTKNTTLKIKLYRYVLAFRDEIEPLYTIKTKKDTTGPTFSISPAPGAYQSATVIAIPGDAHVGMASDLDAITEYTVTRTATGEPVASGAGTRVLLQKEGTFDLTFATADLLGNRGTSPPTGGPPNTYTIDHSPPVLSGVTGSVRTRSDGSLDFSLQFTLSDEGVGVAQSTLEVAVSDVSGSAWAFTADDLGIVPGMDGSITVNLTIQAVPRSARLGLRVVVEDTVGNTLDSNDTSYSLGMPPEVLRASVLSSSITAEAIKIGSALVPRYRIPIAIDQPREDLLSAGVARYRLARRIGSSAAVETATDLAPNDFVSRLVDQDGSWVYWDVLEGARYAHQSFSYEIETVFAVTGSETTQVTGVAAMPNIEAWQVELFSGATSLQTYRSGVIEYPKLIIKSFEGVTARIGPDPEGDALAMRLEYLGPGEISGTVPAGDWDQQIVLADAIPGAPDGDYEIRFIIREDGNAELQNSPWCRFNIDPNYDVITDDVEWRENRILIGPIDILSGGSLRVAEGVQITVAPGSGLTLTVRSGGTLTLSPDCIFQPRYWQAGQEPGTSWQYWGGIIAEGEVRVTTGTIRGAIRGVTATSGSDVTIRDASIEQCRTGVHAIGADADPIIDRTSFIANARYGIKEDLGASPVVTYCVFDSNTYDYYDENLTAIDAEDINTLAPGNNHDNGSSGGSP